VPTQDQILVPETLLKKRKTQEKAQADKLATAKERKEVRIYFYIFYIQRNRRTRVAIMMKTYTNHCG